MRVRGPMGRASLEAALSSVMLSACATMTASSASDAHALFRDGVRPVTWSEADTDSIIAQVKEHDAVGKVLCGWALTRPRHSRARVSLEIFAQGLLARILPEPPAAHILSFLVPS
jgi:hypothetical protein